MVTDDSGSSRRFVRLAAAPGADDDRRGRTLRASWKIRGTGSSSIGATSSRRSAVASWSCSSRLVSKARRAAAPAAATIACRWTCNAWLHIADTGAVTAFTGKVEVGQNIRTSLTQAVAEELHVPLESISLVMGDTEPRAVRHGHLRQPHHADDEPAAADGGRGRAECADDRAAERWQVDADGIDVVDGRVDSQGVESLGGASASCSAGRRSLPR